MKKGSKLPKGTKILYQCYLGRKYNAHIVEYVSDDVIAVMRVGGSIIRYTNRENILEVISGAS